ncbi:LOW QUALITY PROTEIN: uncharacterized protein KZ484_000031 [Pholidichthys leucotaenia]
MDQCEDTEEGVPSSKTPLCGDHESQTKGQRSEQNTRRHHAGPGPGPGPSCVSIKSEQSIDRWIHFKGAASSPKLSEGRMEREIDRRIGAASAVMWTLYRSVVVKRELSSKAKLWIYRVLQQRPASPGPSCVSMKNDGSMLESTDFKDGHQSAAKGVNQQSSEVLRGPSVPQHQRHMDSIFMLLEENIVHFVKKELKKMQKVVSADYPGCLESQREDEEVLEGEDEDERRSSRESFLKITLNFLRRMKQQELAERLQSRSSAAECQHKLKSNLKKRFQCVFEGTAKVGKPSLLKQIYTELYITEGGTAGVNDEHEVRQIEAASRKADRPETTIRPEDIFKGSPGREEPIRRVLTKGVAGIGKTVLTQKLTLDWAEDKANQDIHFTFPFTFRELNVLKKKKFSLVELVHHFFTETKEAGICSFDHFQVLFIFDGLDECRLPLDFHNTEILTDVTESTSVDVLLTNLIRGKLLPSAHLWITTRPAAANQIPPQCVGMVTEVRGFTDPQKEEYFRKRFRDEEKTSRIISHMKTSRSLHIMCHIPVFCWITATVLEDEMKTREGGELPKTLTEMYIHFLVVQAKVKKVKYEGGAETDPHWSRETRKMIESLGKLAFEQLQKGNLIFYESDLAECGIDIRAASVYSGVFTQIFREERGLYQDQVFCFIHLSVQEFLAALHVHLTFIKSGVNLMEEQSMSKKTRVFKKKPTLNHLHQSAVNKALQSPNGHLDLFLRFLLGLSLQTNQVRIEGLMTQTGSSLQTNQETVQYIKEKISENVSAERSINLFHCLNELNDRSLVEEIQQSLTSGCLSRYKLSPAQWSALGFILVSSEKDLDVFDLKKYSASEEVLLRLLPVVRASNKAVLSSCNLSERSCESLSSVLSSQSSSLRVLDLSNNDLKDSGVKILAAGLQSPHCRLETLSLSGCLVSEEGCSSLASALRSNHSYLRELDLSYNHPGESGEKILSALQEDPLCRLETLRMDHGGQQRLEPGVRKYFCQLELDTNSVNRNLKLYDNNRKVTRAMEDQKYPDHPDRFDVWAQLLCRNGLTGRCYWEVEWRGDVYIAVSYRGIRRKGNSDDCLFGCNNQSWRLDCSDDDGYSVLHNKIRTFISSSSVSTRVGVYVDCPAGLLSFYSVSSDTLIHLHTFNTTFTEPVYPGFRVWDQNSSVSLCSLCSESVTGFFTFHSSQLLCVSVSCFHVEGHLKSFGKGEPEIIQNETTVTMALKAALKRSIVVGEDCLLLDDNIVHFVKKELKKMQKVLIPDYPGWLWSQREDEEVLEGEDEDETRSRELFLKISLNFLRRMKQEELAERLQRSSAAEFQPKWKSNLKKRFQGMAEAGQPSLLKQISTQLCITEGGTAEVSDGHEIRQSEAASRKADRPVGTKGLAGLQWLWSQRRRAQNKEPVDGCGSGLTSCRTSPQEDTRSADSAVHFVPRSDPEHPINTSNRKTKPASQMEWNHSRSCWDRNAHVNEVITWAGKREESGDSQWKLLLVPPVLTSLTFSDFRSSNLVVARKKGGGFRPCIDLRVVNKAIISDKHPLLNMEELTAAFSGVQVFSKLDLCQGYLQVQDGTERPVAFALRSLAAAERKYAVGEREVLACVWACKRWHIYLYGRHFTLRTNHQALTTQLETSGSGHRPLRIHRWSERLTAYNLTTRYIPGKDNIVAALLSQAAACTPMIDPGVADLNEADLVHTLHGVPWEIVSPQELREESERDQVMKGLRSAIREGWPTGALSELAPFHRFRDKLSCWDDVCMARGHCAIIPAALRGRVLVMLHEEHRGVVKVTQRSRDSVWWLGIDRDIEAMVKHCMLCLESGKTEGTPHVSATSPVPCWALGTHRVGHLQRTAHSPPNSRFLIVANDVFSKLPEVLPTSSVTTEVVTGFLVSLFARCVLVTVNELVVFVSEVSAMDQCEDTEEGVPPSKTPLCGDHESQTKGQRSEQNTRRHHAGPGLGPGPGPSCVSIKSDQSFDGLIHFKGAASSPKLVLQQRPASPEPSCVSMKSDWSMIEPISFNDGHQSAAKGVNQQSSEVLRGPSVPQHQRHLDSIFMLLEENIVQFVKKELKKMQKVVSADYPECLESQREDEEVLEGEDEAERRSSRESFLKITLNFLRRMKQQELAERLQSRSSAPECQHKLKSNLKKRFQCVFEGTAKAGKPSLLKQIYTELYITEGGTAGVNDEHEVRQIEAASRKADRPETTIRPEDIFKGSPGREETIRRVLTKGVAGIGKTVLTQKFTLDWAEDKANQDIHFTFPFTFRELNVLKEKKFSLVELVHHFFTETKEAGICSFDHFQVLFIFDGLDECRLPLDFHNTEILTDVTESTSVDVLLTNLIRGKLLPSAHLWITTRPAAANQIPPQCVGMVTEVRGFTDPQKEEYFRKRFRDEEQTSRIISHMKTSQSLHIMCHIPVFCWITATVLEDEMKTREGGELPKTLTEMYIHFLVVQAKVKKVKYEGGAETDPHWSPETRKMIESLGKLAFEQLQKGNLIFYESDLAECGIDIRAASVYSGVFTQIFREERGLYQDQVFCFIHLSVQEFLAALHVHLTFIKSGVNLMKEQSMPKKTRIHKKKPKLNHLHQTAVNKALQSPNGHLDLFLRFLLGLSLQTNHARIEGLMTQTGSSLQTSQETVQYIKEKISENVSAERSINLFHCLNELNDCSLVEEIQQSLRSGRLSTDELSPAQWSALGFILVSSEKDLDVFDLKKYSASEEILLRLLPVVRASNKAVLSSCNFSERSCESLSSVLSSQSSSLRVLDLSHNDLKDSGVKILAAGLQSPHCRLETLSLSGCLVSEEGCSSLASALRSNPSYLRELDLSYNHPGESGEKILSALQEDPLCRLETLRLSSCNLSERSCEALSSVLSSQSSSLRLLDLSNNDLKDSGVKILAAGLQSPHCRLETLSLSGCLVSEEGCSSLASTLRSNPSYLRELDLSYNHPGESGEKILSAVQEDQLCRLETLRLSLSERSCEALSSVLSSQSSSLRVLDLSNNNLKDSGVKILAAGLQSPHCRLETLSLSGCLVSEEGCSSLASALRSIPSYLRELDLSYNHPGESGEKILSALQEDPLCRLETLRMDHGGQQRLKPGVRKYFCQLELDTNSVNRNLKLSDNNRKVTWVMEDQNYPDHPDRFDVWSQLLCRNGLTGHCYWEVEWKGKVSISVSYRGIRRKGGSYDCMFGWNNQSWSLECSDDGYSVLHNHIRTSISSSSASARVGVYVDCPAGFLSFYRVSSDTLIHLHTFNTTFTEPLYPGFSVWPNSSMSLCSLESESV